MAHSLLYIHTHVARVFRRILRGVHPRPDSYEATFLFSILLNLRDAFCVAGSAFGCPGILNSLLHLSCVAERI